MLYFFQVFLRFGDYTKEREMMKGAEYMNNVRKLIALILVLAMTAGMFSGCRETEKKDKKAKAKGRYVEKEVGMPENAGEPVGILWQDGKLVLYTYDEGQESYKRCFYENGDWSEPEEIAWLNDAEKRLEQTPVKFCFAADGKVYAMTERAEGSEKVYGTRILTEGQEGKAEDVTPEPLLKEKREGASSWFVDMGVWKDGVVGVGNIENMAVEFYRNGKLIYSIEGLEVNSEYQNTLAASDQTAAVIGTDGKSIDFYDVSGFEKKNTIDTGLKFEDAVLAAGREGIWYLVTDEGIHRIAEDGSMIENVMDGGNGMMGASSAYLRQFAVSGDEMPVFYGLYTTRGRERKLMQYVYDKTVPSVQEETLSVYSMKEDRTVAQAVYVFQSSHSEVKVDYRFAAGEWEQPTADDIRSLNTELLGGSGADVIILDGLPMDSYIEKGILEDLTGLSKKLSKEGVLIDVIGNTAEKNGKVYALPARIRVPVIYGTKDEVNACSSMEKLHEYAQSHPDVRLFGQTSHDLIGMTLFNMMQDELLDKDGTLNEGKLTQLLEDWLKICENGDLKAYEEAAGENEREESLWNELNSGFCSAQEVLRQSKYVQITELVGLIGCSEAYTMAKKCGGTPESLKGLYVPSAIAGVNASSKQKKLAEEFVACLFSEEVQKEDNMSGLSVTEAGLKALMEKTKLPENEQSYMAVGGQDPETGESFMEEFTYLKEGEMESLAAAVRELKTPFLSERVITDTVLDELEKCYSGKQTAKETAKAICRKADAYLSE